jgi:hypothetical protein
MNEQEDVQVPIDSTGTCMQNNDATSTLVLHLQVQLLLQVNLVQVVAEPGILDLASLARLKTAALQEV